MVKHRAALTDEVNFSRLLKAIWAYSGSPVTRTALQLMAILYPRPGELRQATWKEFDLNRAIWTIPASRTKMRREHRKPLPAAATELLIELNQITGHGALTFPSTQSAQRPLSENTLNKAIRLVGFGKDDMTAHGFRATASTLLNESGRWLPDAIEAELAHIGTDNVRSAYNRTPYWEERIRMAAWWSERVAEMQRPK